MFYAFKKQDCLRFMTGVTIRHDVSELSLLLSLLSRCHNKMQNVLQKLLNPCYSIKLIITRLSLSFTNMFKNHKDLLNKTKLSIKYSHSNTLEY